MKGTDITKEVRRKVLERDSVDSWACCIYCGKPGGYEGKGLHLHHVARRSQCGQGSEDNLVTLCFECHSKLHGGEKCIQEYCEKYLEEVNAHN